MGDFLVGKFFLEPRFGALPGFFSFGFVNLVGLNRQIGQDRNASAGNFDESCAGRKEGIATVLLHDDFTRHHLGDKWNVLWVHSELAGHARQCDHLHVFGVRRTFRSDDFKLYRVGHFSARFNFVNPALHVEVTFRHVIVLAFENLIEAAHRFGYRDLFAFVAAEHRRYRKGLAQEALNLAGP